MSKKSCNGYKIRNMNGLNLSKLNRKWNKEVLPVERSKEKATLFGVPLIIVTGTWNHEA